MTEIYQKNYERLFRRLHKSNGHVKFLQDCTKQQILPNFTIISAQTVSQLGLKKSQITKFRLSQLQHKFDEQLEINQNLVYELNHTFTLLSTVTHHSDLKIIIQNIKSKVFRKERKNDQNRQKKLDILMKIRPEKEYAKISIVNFTKDKVQIPEKIEKCLELGLKNPIG